MELQNKFEEIIENNVEITTAGCIIPDLAAKQCTILCLEEKLKVMERWKPYLHKYIAGAVICDIDEVNQQLNKLNNCG